MKKRSVNPKPIPASDPTAPAPSDRLDGIARRIAVLVVKQHRYLQAQENHPEGKIKDGSALSYDDSQT